LKWTAREEKVMWVREEKRMALREEVIRKVEMVIRKEEPV
jgi:hypothetical protein